MSRFAKMEAGKVLEILPFKGIQVGDEKFSHDTLVIWSKEHPGELVKRKLAEITTAIRPTYDEKIEKISLVHVAIGDSDTINRWSVVSLTAQEIADRDRRNDEEALQTGGLKLAHVLVELVTKLIAKGTISATDFTPKTKKMYQDVKAIADRRKS